MAASFFAEDDGDPIMDLLNGVDPKTRSILSEYKRDNPEEVAQKLKALADIKLLLETRKTIFRAAMDKVDLCLSRVAKARDDNICDLTDEEEILIGRAETLFRRLTPKDMILRKCVKR